MELCDRTDDDGQAGRFHVGDVMSVCDVSERTARRIVERVNVSGIVELHRAGRRGYRVTWRTDHPLLDRVLGAAGPRLRLVPAEAPAPAPPPVDPTPPPPVDGAARAALDALEREHAAAKAEKLRVPGVVGERVPAHAASELAAFVLDVAREHTGGDVSTAAREVARAYLASDGHDGILRARSWPIALLRHDLAKISARLATRAARRRADPAPIEAEAGAPPARGFDPAALRALQARLRGGDNGDP